MPHLVVRTNIRHGSWTIWTFLWPGQSLKKFQVHSRWILSFIGRDESLWVPAGGPRRFWFVFDVFKLERSQAVCVDVTNAQTTVIPLRLGRFLVSTGLCSDCIGESAR